MEAVRLAVAACGALVAGVLHASPPDPAPVEPLSSPGFCVAVQQLVAGTTLRPRNVVHRDYAAFQESKTSVDPLTSHQFVLPEPGTGLPWRVSCKVKTPDHLRSHFGAHAARDTGLTCADVNRETVRRVYAALRASGAALGGVPESAYRYEPDAHTYLGSRWVEPYPFVFATADGTVHLQAKSLRVDWDNLWFAWAADKFRGVLYCHLVAPEYVRRLALGTAIAPPAAPG